jgi:aryl-alcohol dehydrogenase-like predicted oxidoreductase
MEYWDLRCLGVTLSVVVFDWNQFVSYIVEAGSTALVTVALYEGINYFDTADVYGNKSLSEEYLGQALAGRWGEVVVATKVRQAMGDGPNDSGSSRYHIQSGVEASLRRLKTDRIDLYQLHAWDASVPIEETLRALDDLVRAGKVRYLGASSFDAWQLAHANDLAEMHGWEAFVSVQPEYNLLARGIERELLPYCQWSGVGILPYFPLAGGFLTGKYSRGEEPPAGTRSPYVRKFLKPENFDLLDQLRPIAEAQGRSLADLAIAWLLAQPGIASVIAGATQPEQIRVNAAASAWVLTPGEVGRIRELLDGQGTKE